MLDALADVANVARFVSFAPGPGGPRMRYCRLHGFPANHSFPDPAAAVGELLAQAPSGTVNLRSFSVDGSQGRRFVYGRRVVGDVMGELGLLTAEGLHVIVNETIDVHDGGVSGVAMGDLVEFMPDDTPRGVEKAGAARLPRALAAGVLRAVYGFAPSLDPPWPGRLEFSLHPAPQGWRGTHTLLWELGDARPVVGPVAIGWPNRFSRLLGDKAYGLLVADVAGLPVPRTTVVGRRLAPFTFGRRTGSHEVWTRTSPAEQVPGLYTTVKGWIDPFLLMQSEDPSGSVLSSVLAQSAVPAAFAGAAIEAANGQLVVEGRPGEGAGFMLGIDPPEPLPDVVRLAVVSLHHAARELFGPVRFEWVFDGRKAWLLQLHSGSTASTSTYLVPGQPSRWLRVDAAIDLGALRELLAGLDGDTGLDLAGEVGLTSHVADLIRRAGVPTRLARG